MAKRRTNGEGTVFRRKDGRYVAAAVLVTAGGARKRVVRYGKTAQEAHGKLVAAQAQVQQGVPLQTQERKLGDYLGYWLDSFVKPGKRPKTYELYELTVRLYLKPGLGSRPLTALSVPMVQTFLNQLLEQGHSVRLVRAVRTTLSAALTMAQREELVTRNVTRLVELPQYVRKEIQPWSLDEAKKFLAITVGDKLSVAFTLLLFYGLRRGEVLGLRWCDVDRGKGVIHVRNQLQRIEGKLALGPVKTRAGQRDLPLVEIIDMMLEDYRCQQAALRCSQLAWAGSGDDQELVFTTSRGTAIEPRNLLRSFRSICSANGLRVIKLHHLRHTTATLLKDLGVPARDAQFILGHASSWMTEQIYQHDSMASRTTAIEMVGNVFAQALETENDRCYQDCYQNGQKLNTLPFMAALSICKIGTPGRIRTADPLFRRHEKLVVHDRLQSVTSFINDCARAWKIGVVAINIAINSEPLLPAEITTPILPSHEGQDLSVSIGKISLFACGLIAAASVGSGSISASGASLLLPKF